MNSFDEPIMIRRSTLRALCGWLLESERRMESANRKRSAGARREENRLASVCCHEARGILSRVIANGGDR